MVRPLDYILSPPPVAEYTTLGLSTREHPMTAWREALAARGTLGFRGLQAAEDGASARIAGQVVMRQAPPTAKGFHFITLEDEDGMMNVIVRPDVYRAYGGLLRAAPLLIVEGQVQRRDGVVNLLARRAAPLR